MFESIVAFATMLHSYKKMKNKAHYLIVLILLTCCGEKEDSADTLFTRLSTIDFINKVEHSEQLDVFRYRNFYNGGGVSIGDINNDGLADIYLTSNLDSNRLFLNKGDFQFEDITKTSGTWGMRAWSTGVTMADVNGDGLLDIYVCNAGNANGDNRENELFINNGDLTFTESAGITGIADEGWSTHAAFFDYDLDGDLDCYVLNNSFRSVNSFDQTKNIRLTRHPYGGDRLYRNDEGSFLDVSEEAGIYGSEIAFGLGIALSDFDQDGRPDLYISNDFFERDYMYLNNGDGTFREVLEEQINHTSQFSMGTDAADLNNDGLPELYITDMLPRKDSRLKTATSFMTNDVKEARLGYGYYNQYMRNSLQLNNGDGTFSEVGLFSDVAATDWSWGAIIADYDNSGTKEIFVTNGISRDVINQDFLMGFQEDAQLLISGAEVDFTEIVERMPQVPLSNYMFKKDSANLQYKNVSQDWGLGSPSYSNGAAYGDLDNDGDLDLVVNNLNEPVSIFRNNSELLNTNNYLKLIFNGEDLNTYALGAKVWLYKSDSVKFYEHYPIRGFQSSMDYTATIGLGSWDVVDKVRVEWPGGKSLVVADVSVNTTLTLNIESASLEIKKAETIQKILSESDIDLPFTHQENKYVDFDYDRLLMHMNSRQGPSLSVADINNDGLDDFHVGGAFGQAGSLFVQQASGGFKPISIQTFESDANFEDVSSAFFDADGDGDLDLYVVSGGSERLGNASFQDRLNLNNENLTFSRATSAIPEESYSGSSVEAADFDNDGDIDLFVGTRMDPHQYGVPVTSMLLLNEGGVFKDVTRDMIPQIQSLGMITDAAWLDYDDDGMLDLAVVGEWMPVTIFKNRGAGFQRVSNGIGLENTHGCWNTIEAMDLDSDGVEDLIAGNLGLNSRFKASQERPFYLYVNDFDENGALDPIYAHYNDEDQLVPFTTKHQLTMQLPYLKKKYLKFTEYAGQTMEQVFGQEALDQSIVHKAETFSSMIFYNRGGKFEGEDLPERVQYSTMHAVLQEDINSDGKPELIIGGNLSAIQPELGQYDANYGLVLKREGSNWEYVPNATSGLMVRGDVKYVKSLRAADNKKLIVFGRNDKALKWYEVD